MNPSDLKSVSSIDAIEEACLEAVSTLVEIHNTGYQGIQLNLALQSDDFLHVSHTGDTTTPEGSIAKFLIALAEYGYQVATEDVMDILMRTYQSEGRQMPTPRPAKAQINLHEILGEKNA
jgi:hypothetical protein